MGDPNYTPGDNGIDLNHKITLKAHIKIFLTAYLDMVNFECFFHFFRGPWLGPTGQLRSEPDSFSVFVIGHCHTKGSLLWRLCWCRVAGQFSFVCHLVYTAAAVHNCSNVHSVRILLEVDFMKLNLIIFWLRILCRADRGS